MNENLKAIIFYYQVQIGNIYNILQFCTKLLLPGLEHVLSRMHGIQDFFHWTKAMTLMNKTYYCQNISPDPLFR